MVSNLDIIAILAMSLSPEGGEGRAGLRRGDDGVETVLLLLAPRVGGGPLVLPRLRDLARRVGFGADLGAAQPGGDLGERRFAEVADARRRQQEGVHHHVA